MPVQPGLLVVFLNLLRPNFVTTALLFFFVFVFCFPLFSWQATNDGLALIIQNTTNPAAAQCSLSNVHYTNVNPIGVDQ